MDEMIGRNLKDHRVLVKIGQGGMAKVYKAYQPGMDRVVALKILPDLYAQDQSAKARFRQEARIIASLEHTHILPVYDFSEKDETPFLVMRYLQAGNLKNLLAAAPNGRLDLPDAALLTSQITSALDYAHQKGIVHRDVKPANVLIDPHGQAFLTDFGIAKVLEATQELTKTGSTLGTPAYMSPEQASGGDVDHRSDIYSLGIILYQMLTGTPPFEADTPYATIVAHLQEPLPLPSSLNPEIPEAVEQVIIKALAKDPNDRYQTAGELAQALQQAVWEGPGDFQEETASPALKNLSSALAKEHPAGELTEGDRDLLSQITRTRRRKMMAPWLVGGFFLMVLVAAGGLIFRASRMASEKESGVIVQVEASPSPTDEKQTATPTITLTPTITPTPTPTLHPMAENPYLGPIPEGAKARLGKGTANDIDLSPDGKTLAIGGSLGVWLYDAETFEFKDYFENATPVNTVMWSPLGDKIAAGTVNNFVILLDPETGERLFTLAEHTGGVLCIEWSPDGTQLASGSEDGTIGIWDANNGELIKTLYGYSGSIRDISWSPESKRIAGIVYNATLLWNVASGALYQTIQPEEYYKLSWGKYVEIQDLSSVSWSHDGDLIIIGSNFTGYASSNINMYTSMAINTYNSERIWDISGTPVIDLLWSASDEFIISLTINGKIQVVDRNSGLISNELENIDQPITTLSLAHDDKSLIGCTNDGSIVVWDLNNNKIIREIDNLFNISINTITWGKDGETIISDGISKAIQVRSVNNGSIISTFDDNINQHRSLSLSHNGDKLAAAGDEDLIIWDLVTGETVSLTNFVKFANTHGVSGHWFSSFENLINSGSEIVWLSNQGYLLIDSEIFEIIKVTEWGYPEDSNFISRIARIDVSTGEVTGYIDNHQRYFDFKNYYYPYVLANNNPGIASIALSPSSPNILASVSLNNTVIISDLDLRKRLMTVQLDTTNSANLSWHPNKMILAGGSDELVLWDIEVEEQVASYSGHSGQINAVVWSADGKFLASCSDDQSVILWNYPNNEAIITLNGHHGPVTSLEFSPDGSLLASGSEDGTIILWDMTKLIDN